MNEFRDEPPEREGAEDGVVEHDVAVGDEDELAGAGLNGGVELGGDGDDANGDGHGGERRASLKAD